MQRVDSDPLPEVSVVVPVYGCAPCLYELHERIAASVGELTDRWEVIYVDDASLDGAWPILRTLVSRDPAVRALRLSRNFGQDAAITAGLSRSRGSWTVVLDCDLEEPPELIPALVARGRAGADIVNGRRRGVSHGLFRRVTSRAYRLLTLQGEDRPAYGTLSALSRPVVDAFLSLQDHDREYLLVIDWLGFTRAHVDFDHEERRHGDSSYTVRRLLRVALSGLFFRTTALLRGVVFLGFTIATVGVGVAAYDVYTYFFGPKSPTGYTSLAVLLLVLVGFVIVSIGVVGLYVGRIFEQVRSRPIFIVEREIGSTPPLELAEQLHAVAGEGPREAPLRHLQDRP